MPVTDPSAFLRAAAVLDALDDGQAPGDAVARVAASHGVGPEHLARGFRTQVGVSPTNYAQHLRGDSARRLLARRSVLDTATLLDESSPGRLHDVVVTTEAVTPGQARGGGRGMVVRHALHQTALGPLLVATSERGVVLLAFTAALGEADALDDLRRRWPAAELVADADATADAAGHVRSRLAGADRQRPLPLLLRGTNLQLAVWRALLRVPEGTCVAYGDLARAVGSPTAVRAVASAVGRNPVAPLVPCHRVLRATGALGGYRWGEATKRRLLAVEAARSLGPVGSDEGRRSPHEDDGPATLAG